MITRDLQSRSSISGNPDPSFIFKIQRQDLKQLFDREGDVNARKGQLNRLKGVEGILKSVQSEADSGIMGDQADLHRRGTKFGKNAKPKPQDAAFWESVKDSLNDRIVLLVAIFAIISIIPGMVVSPKNGWMEGVFILVGLVVSVMISSYNDYQKDQKFVMLQNLNREESLPVVRGKRGQIQTISIWKLVVGDVIHLKPGDKVPADCLVMTSANLIVQEPVGQVGEGGPIAYDKLEKTASEDCFLYTDSFVQTGVCKALVCCVGESSSRGAYDTKFDTREQVTELSKKLDNIGGSLRFVGLLSAIAILATGLIVLFIQKGVDQDLKGDVFTTKLINCFIIALLILIVAIPEGLPMTVAISLAYSVLQMSEDDNVLVRDLNSVETVGQITDLCLGKTGTMTTEEMEVVSFFAQDHYVLNSRKNTFCHCELDAMIQEKIIESVVYNSSAYIEMSENSFYVPVGQGTEVSLIKWLQGAEIAVHEVMQQKFKAGVVVANVPFNSQLKRSIIAINHPDRADTVRIYVKGAPEIVLANCSYHYESAEYSQNLPNGERYKPANKVQMGEEDKRRVLAEMEKMAKNSHRTIAFSYTDMTLKEFQQVLNTMQGDINDADEIARLEGYNQTFLALVGMRDPVRENIKKVIETSSRSGINLYLVSGDNLYTSAAVAADVGLLTQEEFSKIGSSGQGIVMDAKEFREKVGNVDARRLETEEGEKESISYRLTRQENFNNIIQTLKVIGRAEPEDKRRLIAGLKGMQGNHEEGESLRKVAVVGEGINDVEAFKAADVSFALQDGTSIARNNASMVLRSNDFDSAMRAVMWGRNLYMNVQRFLQFQITCNLAVLVVVMVSTITMTESVLNAVQLIYINLIMDILGALALASTRPTTDIAEYQAGQGNIMTLPMYRQIFGGMIAMVAVMMVIMYCGESIFDLDYNMVDSSLTGDKRIHYTLIFNTFIFLQVFNLINCRDVTADKSHGFSNLLRNKMTWFVLLIIIGVQWAACFTFFGKAIFKTSGVSTRQFMITVVSAASLLLANALLKMIPATWLPKRLVLDESKSIGGSSKMMAAFDKAKGPAIRKKQEQVEELAQEEEHSRHQSGDDDEYRQA